MHIWESDMVPRENIWIRMEELQVPSEYMYEISHIYGKVICRVRLGEEISKIISSNIGVKQGFSLSPTLFGVCIDELEHMVLEYMHEEVIEEVLLGNVVIMIFLYADDIVLLAHTQEDAKKLMIILENFF